MKAKELRALSRILFRRSYDAREIGHKELSKSLGFLAKEVANAASYEEQGKEYIPAPCSLIGNEMKKEP